MPSSYTCVVWVYPWTLQNCLLVRTRLVRHCYFYTKKFDGNMLASVFLPFLFQRLLRILKWLAIDEIDLCSFYARLGVKFNFKANLIVIDTQFTNGVKRLFNTVDRIWMHSLLISFRFLILIKGLSNKKMTWKSLLHYMEFSSSSSSINHKIELLKSFIRRICKINVVERWSLHCISSSKLARIKGNHCSIPNQFVWIVNWINWHHELSWDVMFIRQKMNQHQMRSMSTCECYLTPLLRIQSF